MVHASPCSLGELGAICLLLPVLGWGWACDSISSLPSGAGSGWGSCTSNGAWAGQYAQDACRGGLGPRPRTPWGPGGSWVPTLLPMGVASALSLVCLLEKSPFLGSSSGQLDFLGGGDGGRGDCRELQTHSLIGKKGLLLENWASLAPFLGSARRAAKLARALNCYSAPSPPRVQLNKSFRD